MWQLNLEPHMCGSFIHSLSRDVQSATYRDASGYLEWILS